MSYTKVKDSEWWCSLFLCSFLPALIYMRIFALRGFMWLLAWRYVTIFDISLFRVAMFFSQKNKSCTQSICADICAEVSGNFHPNFHYIMAAMTDARQASTITAATAEDLLRAWWDTVLLCFLSWEWPYERLQGRRQCNW